MQGLRHITVVSKPKTNPEEKIVRDEMG